MFLSPADGGYDLRGNTAAVEGDEPWTIRYVVGLAAGWRTRVAHVSSETAAGPRRTTVRCDDGRWLVDGEAAPHLDGCLDVDLESSALTNAFPVHRLGLAVGEQAEAPAAYIRAPDLTIERLVQRYIRLDDAKGCTRYRYAAPAFDFECELSYDNAGLLLNYPGIAVRAA